MKALLVDGLNLVRRIYAAVPASASDAASDSTAGDDHLDGVIAQSKAALARALRQHRPSHCVVAFDRGGRNWRHKLHPDYKKNRPPMPAKLRDALARFERAFGELRVESFSRADYEADDLIATVAVKIAARDDAFALILSTDRNYCQLLRDNIAVFDHFAQRALDAELIANKFQVAPKQLPDLMALAGDSGLSIPGVRTVGVRTAAKLLKTHGTLDAILQAAADGGDALSQKIHRARDDARTAQTLFTLRTDLELGINLNQLRWRDDDARDAQH
ncbi:MAG: 5'-3' exonuclease H3TH domain-containing protein [bacterium]